MEPDPLDALLDELSLSEFVAHVRNLGDTTAHKGMSRGVLKEMYLAAVDGASPSGEDPLDPLRRAVMSFIESKKGRITLSCHGNCFLHSAGRVALCYAQLMPEE